MMGEGMQVFGRGRYKRQEEIETDDPLWEEQSKEEDTGRLV